MEQRGLHVIETNKTFFNKISNTISKLLVPTKLGFNNMMITIRRNSLIKAYENYILAQQQALEEDKKDLAGKKYEDAYSLYLEVIDKNIMDSLYKKVKSGMANDFEKEALAKYYFVVSLKEQSYLEYKYRKQEYLLRIDYETACNIKKESTLKTYKEFYISKIDSLYKGLLKNYSVELTDSIRKDATLEKTYDKIFQALETYISEFLPIKISLNEENKKYQEDYDKYQEVSIGKLNEQEIILKKMTLLETSRKFFTHSLPLGATESCYLVLIDLASRELAKETNKQKQENIYKVLINVIENYDKNLLSGKVYWDIPEEKDEFRKLWDEYNKIITIEDEEEQFKQKKNLFIKQDLKRIYKNSRGNKKIIELYKNYLVEAGVMKQYKNHCKTISGQLRSAKK